MIRCLAHVTDRLTGERRECRFWARSEFGLCRMHDADRQRRTLLGQAGKRTTVVRSNRLQTT